MQWRFIHAMAICSCNGDIFAVFGGDSDAVDISWKRSESAERRGVSWSNKSCSSLWWQWKICFCPDLSSLRWRGSWRCPSRRSPAGQPASSPPPPSPQQQQSLARQPKHMLLIDHHLMWPSAHCPAITRPFNICGQSPLLQEGTGESENNPHPRPGQRKS